jgi:succinate--hydroxymethylglutarate CoA-transferase
MQAGLPCGPINDIREVYNHPQVGARELILESEHPTAGEIKLTGFPYKLSESPPSMRIPPPLLGEHTQEILVDLLGYEETEIPALRKNGAI